VIETLDDLVERQYGEAEGLEDRELVLRFPGNAPVPGRETRADVAARVIPALIDLAERHPASSLIVTTHGGVIRTVLNAVAPTMAGHRGIPITNGSVHSFRHVDGGLELVAFDDPIEEDSIADDGGDIVDQNAIEQRETAG
jgi:uncharacterized phosphatase